MKNTKIVLTVVLVVTIGLVAGAVWEDISKSTTLRERNLFAFFIGSPPRKD